MLRIACTKLLTSSAFIPCRFLYAPATLGIDGYKVTREKIQNQFLNNTEKFRSKMKEFVEEKPQNLIFTEDLKNMIHLAESEDDVQLVIQMIKKFHSQNEEIRFGNYVFGPVVVRMFYYLNDVESALQCIKAPELKGFFDQIISYQIVMDMLYEQKRYQDVLDVFEIVKSSQFQAGKYPKHTVVLAFATYYKMNTKESFDDCRKLWKELKDVGHVPMRKSVTFAAGLAILQNAPHIAIEMLSILREQHYLTVRNLKALAYAEMDRPDDALPVLRSVLEVDSATSTKGTFLKCVVDKVKESIEKNQKKNIETDFKRIETFLLEHGHISEESVDDILSSEIVSTYFNSQKKKTFIAASFSRNNNNYSQRNNRVREGLRDLY